MRLNKYFLREEFKCPCCEYDTVDTTLLEVLTDIREHFNSPVTITSGCRCKRHNEKVGGSKGSWHIVARAADMKLSGVDTVAVYEYLDTKYPDTFGIGLYSTWVHIDTRARKARWKN